MYRYMFRKKARCFVFVLLLALYGGGGTIFALVMSSLVDCAGKGPKELAEALFGGIVYIIAYISVSLCYGLMKNRILADARYHLKDDIFRGIMNQSVPDFEAIGSGEYIGELTNNINLFETVYFGNIVGLLEGAVCAGAAGIVCVTVQPLMLILMIGLGFLTMAVSRLSAEPLKKSTKELAESNGEYTAEIQDSFGGFRLIRSFGVLSGILEKHNRKNRKVERAKLRSEDCRMACSYIGQLVGLLSTVLVMGAAAYFSLKGMFSAGMVIAFGHLIGNIVSPITAVPAIAANFHAAKPLQARFQKLIRREEPRQSEGLPQEEGKLRHEGLPQGEGKLHEGLTRREEPLRGEKPLPTQDMEEGKAPSDPADGIRLEKLSFGYREDREILHDLSFQFRAEGHYAIMGSSGCGKSTLLALLSGYYPDYKGEIYMDGIGQRQMNEESIVTAVAVVPQETFLFHDTLRNNITLYDDTYSTEEIETAVMQAGLKEFVESLPEGLSTVVGENGQNLSGGERQRFGLARALLRKRKVLLLDEFTASLDQKTAMELEERVLELKGCLVIAVTHRTEPEILRRYDQILTLGQHY